MEKYKLPIEDFIRDIRNSFIQCQFKSLEDVKTFEWTKESIEKVEKPIVRFYTEGMCYWFAKMLQDAYPGGRICVWKDHGHMVYNYGVKLYDITGELKDETAEYIPIDYFDHCDFVDSFKHCYIGGALDDSDIERGYIKAKENNDVINAIRRI